MSDKQAELRDLSRGVAAHELADGGIISGRVGEDEVILVRRGEAVHALGAHCTHYKGPLAQGLVVGDTLRCPWHHACFSLKSGEPLRAPALDPVACWRVERQGETIVVREKLPPPSPKKPAAAASKAWPESILIVGGGAAGLAAADMLRREGYDRPLTILSADADPPVDRPNLSKDYLAGTAEEDWIPLREPSFYADQRIDLVLGARVASLDARNRRVQLENGQTHGFGALLLATGAEPIRLDIPGADPSRVHYLRTFADSKAIVAKTVSARRAAVIGASFIGLEVAASLRARNLAVDVIAPERQPMERLLGPELAQYIRHLHEEHGVTFHLERTVARIDDRTLTLSDGSTLEADFVVIGAGVRPSVALAEQAGLATDRGVLVDEFLETSAPGIFAAGDIARWPDARTGERIRVEHWVVAERQGQAAARNLLGRRGRFADVPFFWSQHYDTVINYVGHAERWDAHQVDGDPAAQDCTVTYRQANQRVAVATIFRDQESLQVEAEMERETARA
jgi:3-phenylpropionate/trans-cinnamate dioxygenase ferredoxin reductase subunit